MILDLDDLMCLWLLKPPYARPGGSPVGQRDRTEVEQAFWAEDVRVGSQCGPLCCGRETPDMPWSLGYLWILSRDDVVFVGLARSPVFSSFDDGTAWLADQVGKA